MPHHALQLDVEALPRGLVFLSNLKFDCTRSRLNSACVAEFLDHANALWSSKGSPQTAAVAASDEAISRAPDKFCCQGRPQIDFDGELSRVMSAADFVMHHILPHDKGELFHPVRGPFVELVDRIANDGLDSSEIHGDLQTSRPFAWATPTSDLDSVIDGAVNPAAEARESLGVIAFKDDLHLIVLDYPAEVCESAEMELYPPTALDAGPNLAFRSDEHSTRAGGWGAAVELDGLGQGLPEAVHKPLTLTKDFGVRDLGQIGRQVGVDFTSLWTACTFPWEASIDDVSSF